MRRPPDKEGQLTLSEREVDLSNATLNTLFGGASQKAWMVGAGMPVRPTPRLSISRDSVPQVVLAQKTMTRVLPSPAPSDEPSSDDEDTEAERPRILDNLESVSIPRTQIEDLEEIGMKKKDTLWTNAAGTTSRKMSEQRQAARYPTQVILRPRENKRKVLRVHIKDKEVLACPDSGSEKNIMSEAFANELDLPIKRNSRDIARFELGSGKEVWSMGRVCASVELLGATLGRQQRWFYVFAACPVPLVLGMAFLVKAGILTINRHLLESCPASQSSIPSLLWISYPRKRTSPCNGMRCSLNGHNLVAIADTGSDLNFMCPKCAEREGFYVDTRHEARTCIQIGDGTEVDTIGQVYVSNFSLDWSKLETQSPDLSMANGLLPKWDENSNESGTIFHVLPGLPCDVILGQDLLDQHDAFNRCPGLLRTRPIRKSNLFECKIFIALRKRKRAENISDPKEIHDNERHAEILRRTRREDEINLLLMHQQDRARARERIRTREWDDNHVNCIYCNPV